jgi:hypothetical protein
MMANPPSAAWFSSSSAAAHSSRKAKLTTYQPPPSMGRQKLLIRRQVRDVLKEITSESLAHQGIWFVPLFIIVVFSFFFFSISSYEIEANTDWVFFSMGSKKKRRKF